MLITQTPYPLTFAHKEDAEDDSDHISTYIYSFTSSDNNQRYIIRAEYHKGDVFGIKFYAKNHELESKKSEIEEMFFNNYRDVHAPFERG